MVKATDNKRALWYILRLNNKKRARLNCIRHILWPDSLQGRVARKGQAAPALDERRFRRLGHAEGQKVRAGEILTARNENALPDERPRFRLASSCGYHSSRY